MLAVGIVACLILVTAAVWALRGRGPAKPVTATRAPAEKRFAAVEIRPRSGACDAARALQGQRFLSNEAPPLPLAGCTAAKCSCSFAKLTDRRTDDRRLGGVNASLFLKEDRREDEDRRRDAPQPSSPARPRR